MAQETRIVTFPYFLLCHSLFLALLNGKHDKEHAFPSKTCQGKQTKHQPSLCFPMKTGSTEVWKAWKVCPSSLYIWYRPEGTARHVSVKRKLSGITREQELSGNCVWLNPENIFTWVAKYLSLRETWRAAWQQNYPFTDIFVMRVVVWFFNSSPQ